MIIIQQDYHLQICSKMVLHLILTFKRNYLNFNGNYKFDERLSVETVLNFSQGRTYGEFDDGYSNPTSGSFNQWFARDLDMKKMRAYKDLENSAGYHASWNWFGADSYTGGGINDRPSFLV